MKPRRKQLLLVWGLVAVLAVVISIEETRRAQQVEVSTTRSEKFLLPLPLEQIGAIEILRKGQLHRFERDETGAWLYHGQQDEANAAAHTHRADPLVASTIAQAITMFSRTQKEQPIPLKPGQDEYGVSRPDILVMVYALKATDPITRLAVGTVSPDGYSRYVLPVGANEAVTIAEYQLTNLVAMINAVAKPPTTPTPAATNRGR
ncbi:MAG: hypothetical protein FJY48_08040 [Betaproteobacteria bacterium]|nr:hypothetical protein [Betaproteobacteria bacterium]